MQGLVFERRGQKRHFLGLETLAPSAQSNHEHRANSIQGSSGLQAQHGALPHSNCTEGRLLPQRSCPTADCEASACCKRPRLCCSGQSAGAKAHMPDPLLMERFCGHACALPGKHRRSASCALAECKCLSLQPSIAWPEPAYWPKAKSRRCQNQRAIRSADLYGVLYWLSCCSSKVESTEHSAVYAVLLRQRTILQVKAGTQCEGWERVAGLDRAQQLRCNEEVSRCCTGRCSTDAAAAWTVERLAAQPAR